MTPNTAVRAQGAEIMINIIPSTESSEMAFKYMGTLRNAYPAIATNQTSLEAEDLFCEASSS